jgi:hypothetical protein
MEKIVKPLEQALLPFFKGLPALPENGRKTLVKIWPILALVFGIIQLWSAYSLWNLGHTANQLVNYVNEMSIAAGNGMVTPQLGFFYYLGLVVMIAGGIILLMAAKPLSERTKFGWDLLLLGSALNLAYGIVMLFDTYYGGFGNLLSTVIASGIAFYLLFQVRDHYTGAKAASTKPVAKESAPTDKA